MSLAQLQAQAARSGSTEDKIALAVARHRAGMPVSRLEMETGRKPLAALLYGRTLRSKWRKRFYSDSVSVSGSVSDSDSDSDSVSDSVSVSDSDSVSVSVSDSDSVSVSDSDSVSVSGSVSDSDSVSGSNDQQEEDDE